MIVSILVPIYNVEKYLERCLRSIFEQTYKDIEYIFVNDAASDNSMEVFQKVIAEYPSRLPYIKLINNERNLGIAIVRNMLINAASGEYVYFVDSDDWIEKNTIEFLCNEAKLLQADIVGAHHIHNYGDWEDFEKNLFAENNIGCVRNVIAMRIKPVLWLFLIRRSLFIENQLSFVSGIDVGEDYIMCVKLFYYARRIAKVDKAFYHYTLYNCNSYRTNMLKYRTDTKKSIETVQQFCLEKGIYQQIKESLDYRKFIFKSKYLLDNKNYHFESYLFVFPELNGYWKKQNFRKDLRLYFTLVEHRYFTLASLLNYFRFFVKCVLGK